MGGIISKPKRPAPAPAPAPTPAPAVVAPVARKATRQQRVEASRRRRRGFGYRSLLGGGRDESGETGNQETLGS